MDFTKALNFAPEYVTAADCYSYLDCDTVIINKYVPSRLEADSVCLAQDELPGGGTIIYFEREYYGTLALRIPSEKSISTAVYIDNEEYDYAVSGAPDSPQYALIAGPFEAGCRVKLEITGSLQAPNSLAESSPVAEVSTASGSVSSTEVLPAPEVSATSDSVPSAEASPAPEVSATSDSVTSAEASPTPEVSTTSDSVTSAEESPAPEDSTTSDSDSSAAPNSAFIPEGIKTTSGELLINNAKSRYLIKLSAKTDVAILQLPEGITAEVDKTTCTDTLSLNVGPSLFTGYSVRFISGNSYRDFDVVLMKPVTDNLASCAVHAYTDVTGAFSGEACYILDRTSTLSETASHASSKEQDIQIDPLTGYKWGRITADSYFFELENGMYEVNAAFTLPGSQLISGPGAKSEKVLISDTSTEMQRAGIRIKDNKLILKVASESSDTDFTTLIIRAIDTIAEESGYISVDSANKSAGSISPKPVHDLRPSSVNRKPSSSKPASSGRKKTAISTGIPDRSAMQKYINSKLATQKTSDAAKTFGFAAGALAVAGSIIAILGKDRK